MLARIAASKFHVYITPFPFSGRQVWSNIEPVNTVIMNMLYIGYDTATIVTHKRGKSVEQIALPIYRAILPIPTKAFMVNDFINVSVHPTDKFPSLARCDFFR
ncbi:hypothetical protein PMJ10TS2_51940 [Paenibacillus melissococcoides]